MSESLLYGLTQVHCCPVSFCSKISSLPILPTAALEGKTLLVVVGLIVGLVVGLIVGLVDLEVTVVEVIPR